MTKVEMEEEDFNNAVQEIDELREAKREMETQISRMAEDAVLENLREEDYRGSPLTNLTKDPRVPNRKGNYVHPGTSFESAQHEAVANRYPPIGNLDIAKKMIYDMFHETQYFSAEDGKTNVDHQALQGGTLKRTQTAPEVVEQEETERGAF